MLLTVSLTKFQSPALRQSETLTAFFGRGLLVRFQHIFKQNTALHIIGLFSRWSLVLPAEAV